MRSLLSLVFVVGLLACFGSLSGCKEKGPMEKAGAEADKATDNAGDAMKDAGDAMKDAADNAPGG